MSKLVRGLSLGQSVAINMIDMVGIGPFVTMPFVIGAMSGPQSIIAWLLGALLAFADGAVWAELGARWPEAGGSYAFLQNLYGRQKWGRLMAFLYVWQTSIQAPLVIASGAIGFAQYLTYLVPTLGPIKQKAVSGGLVILITILLYRKISDIGKISVAMGMIVIGTILWLIFSGFTHFDPSLSFAGGAKELVPDLTPLFFFGLGQASLKTVYSYLGYYNVCHLGGEVKEPEVNIPRSIFISIAGIAILYLSMHTAVLGTIPWQEAKDSKFIVSLFFERIYGHTAALVATVLVLLIAISSLFAVMLGYSRVPYAAATDGNFFSIFSHLHPTKHFPYVSLLVMAGVAFAFSLLFRLGEVISAIVTMRIIIQFVGQAVGLLLYHAKMKEEKFSYRMWLYPMPAIVALLVWGFIFCYADVKFILGALVVIVTGIILYLIKANLSKEWPFAPAKTESK
ncbi:MAG: APC family permease [Bacteroidetes bacterium]|nr:APC family permease [Bacteroidota bacterium]